MNSENRLNSRIRFVSGDAHADAPLASFGLSRSMKIPRVVSQ